MFDPSYIFHLSPSTMYCIASVQPLMTWFGANVVGLPRLYEESNSVPVVIGRTISFANIYDMIRNNFSREGDGVTIGSG